MIEGELSQQRERSEGISFFRVEELRELKEITSNNNFVDKSRLTEDFGFDSSCSFEFVEEENMLQSSDSEEELGDSSQDEKEIFEVIERFEGVLENLFTDTTIETRSTLDEVVSHRITEEFQML